MLRYLEPLGYVGLALVLAGATWWLLSTVERANAADRLERELTVTRELWALDRAHADAVNGLTSSVNANFARFLTDNATKTQVTRERIIREVPSGNPCFGAATVRLLNAQRGGAPALPAPTFDPQPEQPAGTTAALP